MERRSDSEEAWWKLCNHPLVQGLHRLITIVAAPCAVGVLMWAAHTFDGMRTELVKIKTTIDIQIPELAHRLDRVEAETRR